MQWGLFVVSGLSVGAVYAMSGVGLVLLYRATGVLNFANGALGAIGALLTWQLVEWGWPAPLGWAAAILIAMGLSLAYGWFLAPALAYREPVVKAVATLGLALIVLGLLNWLWPQNPRRLPLPTDAVSVEWWQVRITGTRALALAVAVVATLGLGTFFSTTRTGLCMRALANNRDLSRLLGLRVRRVEALAWLISGGLCGLSGLLLGNLVRLDAGVLTFLVIPAMAAAVIGRLQSLGWTLMGGLLIGVLEALGTLAGPWAPFRSATPFLVAVAAILLLQRKRRLTFAGQD
ncbi:MAG: branched-chain amino acid ABC transporter permease [Chitinophagaceae bacterium]|nr:branched-chain amino acid ABC transporter permease [Rubrivivax sp.]